MKQRISRRRSRRRSRGKWSCTDCGKILYTFNGCTCDPEVPSLQYEEGDPSLQYEGEFFPSGGGGFTNKQSGGGGFINKQSGGGGFKTKPTKKPRCDNCRQRRTLTSGNFCSEFCKRESEELQAQQAKAFKDARESQAANMERQRRLHSEQEFQHLGNENYFEILQMPLQNNPTKKEIEKQYKKLALIYHPDKPEGSAEEFRKLTEARDFLLTIVKE